MVCIIVGQPGVGKTHVKYLLLDKRPPHLRSSTICAETPVRIEVRSVSGSRVQNIRGNWKEVSDEEMLDIVARMILQVEPQLSQKSEQGFFSKVAKLLQLDSTGSAGAKLPNLDSAAWVWLQSVYACVANNSNTTYKLIQHTEPHVYLHMSFSSSVTPEDSCGRWEAACRIKQVLDSYMYM